MVWDVVVGHGEVVATSLEGCIIHVVLVETVVIERYHDLCARARQLGAIIL